MTRRYFPPSKMDFLRNLRDCVLGYVLNVKFKILFQRIEALLFIFLRSASCVLWWRRSLLSREVWLSFPGLCSNPAAVRLTHVNVLASVPEGDRGHLEAAARTHDQQALAL